MFLHQYKKASIVLLVVSSLLLITSCSVIGDLKTEISDKISGRVPADAPDPLVEIKETASSKLLWQTNIGASQDYDFSPVIEAGYAYVASATGEISKLDAISGKQEWRVNVGETLSGGVGVGGSLVLVGTQKGIVYAYDIAGKLQWKSKLSSEILSAPKYFDGLVIVRTGDSHIYGLMPMMAVVNGCMPEQVQH